MNARRTLLIVILAVSGLSGCAGMRSFFAMDPPAVRQPPIQNPFVGYHSGDAAKQENIVLRTKKGDRAVEIELPGNTSNVSDFVVPVSPAFRDSNRSPASTDAPVVDEEYKQRAPTLSDREIVAGLPQASPAHEGDRREVETGLGMVASDDTVPVSDQSYLATVDHIKQLYKGGRYEAALVETDELLRAYPTDPKLYEMRGTLFDRTGREDLALRSWNQALRLDPKNQSLKKFVERKQQKRSLASP